MAESCRYLEKSTSKTHQWLYYLMELPITPWLVAAPGGRPWIWLFPILIAFWLCFYKNRPKILQKKILHYTGASGSRSLLNKFKSQVIPREPLKFKDVIKQKIRKISIWNFFLMWHLWNYYHSCDRSKII